ncbi:MAG: hypothetical protein HY319_32425 [Armatimonadetes bacterium]|nr:hypothetical protein [Armatimonadota bacterium]
MADLEPTFLDTSVLLPGLIDFGPSADPAQKIMTAVADLRLSRPHTAWHCCLEFFSVSTRLPAEVRLSVADATRLVLEEILPRFAVHQLPERAFSEFFLCSGAEGVAGGRIYDAHIAEVARLAGSRTVVTDNVRHFGILARHGVRVVRTREFAAAARL